MVLCFSDRILRLENVLEQSFYKRLKPQNEFFSKMNPFHLFQNKRRGNGTVQNN